MTIKSLFALLILSPLFTNSQKNYSSLLDQYMQAQSDINKFSGTVLITQKGKILYEKAFGLANTDNNTPNTIHTKYRIGSISKQFTAASVLWLVQKGKLNLDDKLTKFFPDYPGGGQVTIHMLLTHTSGIKNLVELPGFYSVNTRELPADSILNFFKNQPYDFTPGTKYHYSNSGYILLASIVEKVSGERRGMFLSNTIFKKAGLQNTELKAIEDVTGNKATGYAKQLSGWRLAKNLSLAFSYGAGDLVSTAEDLYKWNRALFTGKIISSPLFTKMITPDKGNYGYGTQIDFIQGHKRIYHTGEVPGFRTTSDFYPADQLYIAVLSNNGSWSPLIGQALAAIVFDVDVILPHVPKQVEIDSSVLKQYTGVYQQRGSIVADIFFLKNGRLYFHPGDQNREYELRPESENLFFLLAIPDVEFFFENGKAYVVEAGLKKEMKKLQ